MKSEDLGHLSSNLSSETAEVGTQAEYAKHRKRLKLRGETESAVSQAVKAGRLEGAIRPDGLIDFAIADLLWGRGTRIDPAAAAPVPELADNNPNFALLKAKLQREQAEAELATLKAGKARADLMDVDEARKMLHAIGRMYSAARENVPAQIAPKLVGKTDLAEIEAIIRSFYRDADSRVADEIESRYKDIAGSNGD